jgi:hypothetical protein
VVVVSVATGDLATGLTAAVEAAARVRDEQVQAARAVRDEQAQVSAHKLADALAAHDDLVSRLDARASAAEASAAAGFAATVAKAESAFDAEMRARFGVSEAAVVGEQGATLFLRAGRTTVGSVTPSHGGHWRVNRPDGIVMVGDRAQARAALWGCLDQM